MERDKHNFIPRLVFGLIIILILLIVLVGMIWGLLKGSNLLGFSPLKQNIEIAGKQGLATLNIYLKSNPSESSKYYSVYRYRYKYGQKLLMMDFNSVNEIKRRCKFLSRTTPDSNSLIYTDWNAMPSKTMKYGETITHQGYSYAYFVIQDDGDFSNAVIFD